MRLGIRYHGFAVKGARERCQRQTCMAIGEISGRHDSIWLSLLAYRLNAPVAQSSNPFIHSGVPSFKEDSMRPKMLTADERGNICDSPHLLMLCSRAGKWQLPHSEDLLPLPPESELFLLPGRKACGFNQRLNKIEVSPHLAVAAFAAPGHTLSANPAYQQTPGAPLLPLFAYGAVGYANGKLWICARKVDADPRQKFDSIPPSKIVGNCRKLLREYPQNRLVGHIINNCVGKYACPAARNFALGRYEAPLPTSRICNARCLGCISERDKSSPLPVTPQCRLEFTPTTDEIVEVMSIHGQREKRTPIYSFGQGCEGDPLLNAALLAESIRQFRAMGGKGTINCNTNASLPDAVATLCRAGLTSLRVSLNSARPDLYSAYYRPQGYNFDHVVESIRTARRHGVFVSLNLLFFPGITDTSAELFALSDICARCGVEMIQWRNLNIDPGWYFQSMRELEDGSTAMGLAAFMLRLRELCPWLRYGYFNPYLGEKAPLASPPVN